MEVDCGIQKYRLVLIHVLVVQTLYFTQTSNAESCNTILSANSQTILDSNTHHTTDMNGQMVAYAIPGWIRIDKDDIIYSTNSGLDNLQWRPPTIGNDLCGPNYLSCFQGNGTTVNSTQEMNWLVTSYYETEANVIHVRVRCSPITGIATDCRDAFQIFYYQSDQSVTTITSSLLSQFLPADSNKTVDRVVSAEFSQSEKGFYIGFFNNIPCTELTEILFYYFECPATNTSDLYSLPATPAPSSSEGFVRVNISCPAGSVSRDPLLLVAECHWDGTWRVPTESVCACEAGYYLSVVGVNSSMPCVMCGVDTYKGEVGNDESCVVCPFRSSTRDVEGSSECLCDSGWYRGEGESVSEGCGQSPSAVVNLRVERVDSRGTVSRVVWDEPLYLGNRGEDELRYNVSYYPSLTPFGEKRVVGLRESEFVLMSGDVVNSTEYVFVVTSWNSVSFVSGVFNRANVTVLSSFPTLVNISYDETSGYLEWSYELFGRRDYVFEVRLNQINVSYVSVGNDCRCSVFLGKQIDLLNISICLLLHDSRKHSRVNLICYYPFASLPTSIVTSSNSVPTPIIISVTIVTVIVLLLILLIILLFVGIFILRRKPVLFKFTHKKFDYGTLPITANAEKQYQDPSMHRDINKAVRSLAKELDKNDIQIENVIGEGEFGEVCRGTLKINNRTVQVAVKELKPYCGEKKKKYFLKESSAMAQFSHENVIYLYGIVYTRPIMIVTPFMENGSLDRYLVCNKGNIQALDLGRICLGVSNGMCYLSGIGFVHQNILVRNVLIDSDLTPKIADFGLSRETEENIYNVKTGGKIRWTAPEAILYRRFNMSSDVWSFGVLMWEVMSCGDIPYGDMDNFKLLENVQHGHRLKQPHGCPAVLYQLMLSCWDSVPENRPSFSELVEKISTMVENNFMPPRGHPSRSVEKTALNFTTVDEWLAYLHLERYSENFRSNGYSMISSIWHMTEHDIMAIDIIPVGHRNEIMRSIHEANNKISRTYAMRV